MTGLKRTPSKVTNKNIDAFVDGAEKYKNTQPSGEHPWDAPEIRDDVLKLYNLRLPESYLLKLKYIANNTPGSMQRFCLDILLPAIDEEIDRLTK